MSFLKYNSENEKETRRFARKLAKGLKENDSLALIGDFGSGKTTFVRGLAEGMGLKKKGYVCSPSFVILKIYNGRLPIYHFDLYRLNREVDAEAVGLSEFFEAGGVAVVEWAEKVKSFLPDYSLVIKFFNYGNKSRELHFFSDDIRLRKAVKKAIGR